MPRRRPVPAGIAAALMLAAPAGAHVATSPDSAPSGGFTRHAFRVPHGCDGSPTVTVRIRIPEGVQSVKPEHIAGWQAQATTVALDPPVEGPHGEIITERVSEVSWRGGPLPDDQFAEFGISMRLPEAESGTTLWFPTIQECEQGRLAWIEIPEEGAEEPEHPAPGLRVTGASGGHGSGADEVATGGGAGDEAAPTVARLASASDVDSAETLAVVALVVGALGLLAGLAGFALGRRRPAAGS